MAYAVASNNAQKVVGITAAPTSASGAPALIDGPLRITVVSGDATPLPDPTNPLVFDVISGAAEGVTEFLVEADASLDGTVTLISDTLTYTVVAAPVPQATAVGLSGGVVEPK